MRRFRTTALALTAIALLVLGGCGDDDGSAATDTTSQDVATDATNGDDSDAVDDTDGVDDADDADDTEGSEGSGDESADAEIPDACTLVEPAEVEELIGAAEPEGENDVAIDGLRYSQCSWENDDGLFIVAVVEGRDRYDLHTQNLPGEPLDGVGDEALTAPGVSSETKGATGGRTISALVGGRTLVVALRVEGQTTVEMVAPIATTIAGRLGG